MFCPKCGKRLFLKGDFCPGCGASLGGKARHVHRDEEEIIYGAAPEKPKVEKYSIWNMLISAAICGGAVFHLSRRNPGAAVSGVIGSLVIMIFSGFVDVWGFEGIGKFLARWISTSIGLIAIMMILNVRMPQPAIAGFFAVVFAVEMVRWVVSWFIK